jgi:hypothetical protein
MIVAGLGAVVLLIALGGFLRGLWAKKPKGSSSSSDWSSDQTVGDWPGDGGDVGDGGH